MFNKNKFRAKLVEQGQSVEHLASVLGLNPATLYRKIAGESDFVRHEIQTLKQYLKLSDEDVMEIFFAA